VGISVVPSDAERQNGYLNKEIFRLDSLYGTAGDGDDRQGNGPPGGCSAAFLFISLCKYPGVRGRAPGGKAGA
jgi:hypothetical protein